MDLISALRNVVDGLAAFEDGECLLQERERDVRGVLRTSATDFDGELWAFEASGGGAGGLVVLAAACPAAWERVESLVEDSGRFDVAPVE